MNHFNDDETFANRPEFVDITVYTNIRGRDLDKAIFIFEHFADFLLEFTNDNYGFDDLRIYDFTEDGHFTL